MSEEIKQEAVVEEVKIEPQPKIEYDFNKLDTTLEKLIKENEILKKEILSLKDNTQVGVNPVESKKPHEINLELWKDKF